LIKQGLNAFFKERVLEFGIYFRKRQKDKSASVYPGVRNGQIFLFYFTPTGSVRYKEETFSTEITSFSFFKAVWMFARRLPVLVPRPMYISVILQEF